MLPTRDDIGRALTLHEEERLLSACEISRSRLLQPVVILALSTAMRYGEIRLLTWKQLDLDSATVVVGKSKTAAGTDRLIPLNSRALVTLRKLAEQFPDRCAYHYVFPSEKYGGFGDEFKAGFYNTDPTRPVGDWKEAWEAARRRAKVTCRFHDLRHTACTRMLEGGVPYPVVASIMGWSAATAIRMSKRYGHIGQKAHLQAVAFLEGPPTQSVKEARGSVALRMAN
jgi:integrase